MKSRTPFGALLAIALLVACAGLNARQKVLLPAMNQAWPQVVAAISHSEPSDQVKAQVDMMDVALKAESIDAVLAVDWPMLQQAAIAGINARMAQGEIGPGVASSLLERIVQFRDAWNELNGGAR